MSVRKRSWTTGKGEKREAWIVDYTDQQGARHIETFQRKKDADDFHATVRVDVAKGTHTPASKSPTVAEAATIWLNRVEANGAERSTLRQYKQHVDLHIVPRLGATKVSALNQGKCEQLRDDLLGDLSRPMARKVLTSFKSILKAVGQSHIAAAVGIKADKRKRKLEVGVDIPEPAEVRRIVQAIADDEPRDRALILTVVMAGLRASELRALRWKDVDFAGGEVHVRQRADRWNRIGTPKSDSSVRSVPMPPELVTALKVWKLKCPNGDLAFPTSTGAVEHHKNMDRHLEGLLKAAEVVTKDKEPKAKYGLHSFRHFFASWCINQKSRGGRQLPAKEVQTLLGHSSIVMTLDIYGHLFPRGDDRDELAEASRVLLG